MKNNIITKSLNKVSYISTVTNYEATVGYKSNGINFFSIERNDVTEKASDSYEKAVRGNKELMVDLVKFNHYIRKYKVATIKK